MRYLLTLLLAALSFNAVGQTNQNYNPDYDDDGSIGVNDILGILSTFGDTWDSGDVMVIEITPITNDNIHEAVDLWLSDECSATLTYGHISDWEVSSVASMTDLFGLAESFNEDISSWDVSSVTNMQQMFRHAYSFNGDLSGWDVSSVTNMNFMFGYASSFNSDISAWDVSSVTDMTGLFREASSFNGDISSWDVSSVTGMSNMFLGVTNFDSDISVWDVSSVTDMTGLFREASSFNVDLSSWDVSSVTEMNQMFYSASLFNGDISSWDVSSVTDMDYMFSFTSALSEENQCAIHTSFSSNENWPYDWSGFCLEPLTNGNINSAVAFWLSDESSAEATYGHISDWDVSNVTIMSSTFHHASSFNGDISSWDVSNVDDMNSMFNSASNFNGDISSWDVSNVTDMNNMFNNAVNFNQDLSSWDVSSVIGLSGMFQKAVLFDGEISTWDVSSVTDMSYMFMEAYDFNKDLSTWDVSNVTYIQSLFYDATDFNGDISSWDVSSVTDMHDMFDGAYSFNGDISSWNVSSVSDFNNMFNGALALSEENQCAIHTSFSSNENWQYDWSGFCVVAFVCGDDIGHEGYGYSTVQIGEQCWFSENCRYIPVVSPSSEGSYFDPYYYVYEYEGTDVEEAKNTTNYLSYGVLYNWEASKELNVCPNGWHVPADSEWTILTNFLGGESVAGNAMKSTSGWYGGGGGTNSSGFNGLAAGYRNTISGGSFNNETGFGYFWRADAPDGDASGWARELSYNNSSLDNISTSPRMGLSARCIKD